MNHLVQKWMNSSTFSPEGEGGTPAPASTPAPVTNSGTPASAPAGAASTPASAEPSSDGDAFAEFGSNDDFDSIDLGTESSPSPEPGTTAPVAAPVVDPAVATPPATPVKAAERPPVQVAADPKGAPVASSPPSELDTMLSGLTENAPALTDWLAANAYALTKEETDAFELDAVGQIPKLMAKVQVATMKAAVNLMKNLIPKMIDSQVDKTTGAKTRAKEALDEFYSTNSDLNTKDHSALVDKWSKAFRAQNPSASRQEAIKFVGSAIRTELGLPPLVAGAKPAAATKPQPFAPARPGARAPVAQVVEENPFAALGMDIEE